MGRPIVSDLSCSFCRKPGNAVAKLISSPSDHPMAYICDECVAVCSMVIADECAPMDALSENDHITEATPLLSHPLASRLLLTIERWIKRESLGADAAEDIAEVRNIAGQMIAETRSVR
jgi:hypothetical protein